MKKISRSTGCPSSTRRTSPPASIGPSPRYHSPATNLSGRKRKSVEVTQGFNIGYDAEGQPTGFSTPLATNNHGEEPPPAQFSTPLATSNHDTVNDTEIFHEDEDELDADYSGGSFDYGDYMDNFGGGNEYDDTDDNNVENDCVDGRIEPPQMVDSFLHGEEGRTFRSKAWNEFIKVRVAGIVVKGRCKHCNCLISAKRGAGTSAMRTHLKRCKVRRRITNVIGQLNATVMSPEGVAIKDWKFNQEASRAELVRMIVLHELPFSIVEYDGFRKFVSSLNPLFKMLSRRTITIDCLKSFEEHKQELKEVFKNVNSRVSLTMDMWTSNQTLGYMCITCHYIDDQWKIRKRILKFSFIKSPHTGVVLFNAVVKYIQEWNIEDKLFSITLDNASNNNAMVKLLKRNLLEKEMLVGRGRLLHQRCAAHVLNLICQSGLQVLNPIIHKIRESVKYVQGSQSRKQKFEEIVQQLGMSGHKRPKIDVSSRWNSTYHMVEDALEFKRAFESLKVQDTEYTCAPSLLEWEKARVIGALLKVFCEATNVISGTLYPTTNLHFHEIWEVKVALEAGFSEMDDELLETINFMQRKFKKYWKLTWLQISVPVLLDPRFKLGFIEFRFGQAFGNEATSKVAALMKVFLRLFKDYSQLNGGTQEMTQQELGTTTTHASGRFSDWDNHISLSGRSTAEVPTELEAYFAKPPLPRGGNFDILAWWKSNSLEYPTLSCMARDILVVPASTVASESAFSTGSRVISDFRSRLAPKTVEALICLQDWMRASGSSQLRMEAIFDVIEEADESE